MRRYNPKEIEPKWQKIWDETKIYQAEESNSKPKKYFLEYFPYPSGYNMHVGHVRNYTIGDVLARHSRMAGNNVMHPMGWDAFGLPAENFAIKNNVLPRESNDKNIKTFKKQLMQMGFSYDWSREVDSSKPDYYKWTQWLFLQFYKHGLAYRAKSLQNWCPTDKTVLANEQVINKDSVNVCERDGTPVVQKEVEQWFLKISDYADRLVDDLEDLDWPEGIKAMQRNWIGRSQGASIKFQVAGTETGIEVFTTRPDTIFGATFLVLAPEHKMLNQLSISKEAKEYIEEALNKTELDRKEGEKDKTGVFTGLYAINPAHKEKVPIWVADYVLMNYGSGAIMAVPAHDQRDYDFAKKHKLPIKFVIEPTFGEAQGDDEQSEKIFVALRSKDKKKVLVLNWGPRQKNYGGHMMIGGSVEKGEKHQAAAEREIAEETGYKNFKLVKKSPFKGHGYFYSNTKHKNIRASGIGFLYDLIDEEKAKTNLDDGEKDKFKISWEPIEKVAPMLDDGIHEAMYRYLVLDEPYAGEGILAGSGRYDELESAEAREKIVADLKKAGVAKEKTEYRLRDWSISRQRYWGCPIPVIYCDKDGIVPVPEKDLPVKLPENVKFKPSGQSPLKDLPEFVDVKCPKCGEPAKRETDTFDTFIDSSWYFFRFADAHNDKSAFDKNKVDYWLPVDSYIGGAEHAVVHLLYARFWTKAMKDFGLVNINEPFHSLRNHGMIGGSDGRKMGKRYGNVVTPDELIDDGYGADALRLYELFIGPYNQTVDWNPRGIAGTYRFLDRLWVLVQEFLETDKKSTGHNTELEVQISRIINKALKKVSQDLEGLGFNTVVASLMAAVNDLYKLKSEKNFSLARTTWQQSLIILTQMLAPFAPHIAEEVWGELGQAGSVHVSKWPAWDESLVEEETITLAVQINGKVRAEIEVPADIGEAEAIQLAKTDTKIASQITGKKIVKEIYVSGRLVSLVLK